MEETAATTETAKPIETAPAAETPRVRTMFRPAPVPAGHIGVEIHDAPNGLASLWFLVRLDPACPTCSGTGKMLVKADDGPFGTREDYCEDCIKPVVREAIKKMVAEIDEHEATQRAERGDAALLKRLEDARAKVAAMEKERDAALAGNKEMQEETVAMLAELRAETDKIAAEISARMSEHAGTSSAFIDEDRAAKDEHARLVRQANEMLAEKQRDIAERRKAWVAQCANERHDFDDRQKRNLSAIDAAEANLKRLQDGPAKMAKRWEEKLKPARATVERLERRYNGTGNGGGE